MPPRKKKGPTPAEKLVIDQLFSEQMKKRGRMKPIARDWTEMAYTQYVIAKRSPVKTAEFRQRMEKPLIFHGYDVEGASTEALINQIVADIAQLDAYELGEYIRPTYWRKPAPRQSREIRDNPLLAVPPAFYHRIRDESRLKGVMGEDPHHGVHTTSTFNIAASYAMNTWRANSKHGYPVVITLDVTGLTPLPDVDACLQAQETLYEPWYRKEVKDRLEEGWDVYEFIEYFSEREYSGRSQTPEQIVFEEYQGAPQPFSVIEGLYDPDKAQEVIERYANGAPLPGEVLMEMVDQRRFLTDFHEDRVYKIEAFRPWHERIVDAYWGEPPWEQTNAEENGYHVVILEEILESGGDFDPGEVRVLYERPGSEPKESQYHGTVSFLAAAAFPDIPLPDPEGNYWNLGDI